MCSNRLLMLCYSSLENCIKIQFMSIESYLNILNLQNYLKEKGKDVNQHRVWGHRGC